MKNKYKHLSCEERDEIAVLRARGYSYGPIAHVIGRNKSTVLRESRSRMAHLDNLPAKKSHKLVKAITKRLRHYPKELRRTITYDNGSENVEHEKINKMLGTKSYFCNPFHRWEKGSVENSIGLVRRFLPKKTDFAIISPRRVRKIEYLLNNRPRKCLGFQTPQEVMDSIVALTG